MRLNAWAAYAVLLAVAGGNWEIWIARYNLQPRFAHIDIGFLLDMPGRVLPTLRECRAVLSQGALLTAAGAQVHRAADGVLLYDTASGNKYDTAAFADTAAVLTSTQAQLLLDQKIAVWQAAYAAQPSWQSQC